MKESCSLSALLLGALEKCLRRGDNTRREENVAGDGSSSPTSRFHVPLIPVQKERRRSQQIQSAYSSSLIMKCHSQGVSGVKQTSSDSLITECRWLVTCQIVKCFQMQRVYLNFVELVQINSLTDH